MSKDPGHIACITRATDAGMEAFKMPVGSMIIIHEDEMKQTAPMAIMKVTMKHIDLRCMCRNPKCTLTLRLRIERAGNHPLLVER